MGDPNTVPLVEWTSWEGNNFVLKGLVDELISLGAKPRLNSIALQLWVKYLRKLEVAFTSTTEQLLPKFGLNQTAKDYTIIKNQACDRKRDLKRKLKLKGSELDDVFEDSTASAKKKVKLGKNVFADYESILLELEASRNIISRINDQLKLSGNSTATSKHKVKTTNGIASSPDSIQYNKKTKSILTKLILKEHAKNNGEENNRNAVDVACSYTKFSSTFDPMFLTRQKVLALLCLALMFTKDAIQLSDVLRWTNEGHLSYFNVARLFPEGVVISHLDVMFLRNTPRLRYKSLQHCIFNMANLFEIQNFPAPNLLDLARRFILELQLPTKMVDYVEKLMAYCKIHRCVRMMSYEAVVMAFIIVVLKTLFGLDGKTEHCISSFAEQINRLLENDAKSQLSAKLFVWDDWVSYINCRKAVILDKHFPTRYRYKSEETLTTDAAPYVHYCNEEKRQNLRIDSKKICRETRNAAHKRRLSKMMDAVKDLPKLKSETYSCEFTPSLTPYVSYLEIILSYWDAYESECNRATIKKLSYDHTTTSMDFLIHPQLVVEFARGQGVTVSVENSPAIEEALYISSNSDAMRAMRAYEFPKGPTIYIAITDDSDRGSKNEPCSEEPVSVNMQTDFHSQRKRKKKKHCGSSEVENVVREYEIEASTTCGNLTLFLPPLYWEFDLPRRQGEHTLEDIIQKHFNVTFRWLLNECSTMLEMKPIELYTQLRTVEQLCFDKVDVTSLQLHFSENSVD